MTLRQGLRATSVYQDQSCEQCNIITICIHSLSFPLSFTYAFAFRQTMDNIEHMFELMTI